MDQKKNNTNDVNINVHNPPTSRNKITQKVNVAVKSN